MKNRCCALAVLALFAAAPVHGATLTFTSGYVYGTNTYAGIHTPVPGVNGLYYADGLLAQLNGGTAFWTFCVDANHEIAMPPYSYRATAGSMDTWSLWPTPDGGKRAAYVYDEFLAYVAAHPLANTHQLRGAVQLAIWEVLYDTDRNLHTGSFNVYSDPYTLVPTAQAWLNALPAQADGDAAWLRLNNIQTGVEVQGFIAPVPEPVSLVLLGSGLVFAGVAARRRRPLERRSRPLVPHASPEREVQ